MTLAAIPYIPDVDPDDLEVAQELLERIQLKSGINQRRKRYVEAKQTTRHLGIAIPPQLESVETVIGWPEKAVAGLEQRIDLDGFTVAGGTASDLELGSIWTYNRLGVEATEAHTSALTYGVSFLAVMAGPGDIPIVRTLSPLSSTVLWDRDRRRAAAALTILKTRDNAEPEQFILFTDERILTFTRTDNSWEVEDNPHGLGRCPVAVLPYRPSAECPLGRSRVSRAVMSITDRAVRTLLRMEVSAEFYSTPQRAILGADDSMFRDANGDPVPKWTALISRYLAAPLVEDDAGGFHTPQVQQFPQMTMQPHMDMVRSDAAMFSGETSIPVNALGVIHDNPASDAAMHTAYLDLDKAAERAHVSFGYGWADAMTMAVQIRDGVDEVPEITARFRDPATPTKAALSDAVMKQIQVGVLDPSNPTDLEIALEQLSYDRATIDRILIGRRRTDASSLLATISQRLATSETEPTQARGEER